MGEGRVLRLAASVGIAAGIVLGSSGGAVAQPIEPGFRFRRFRRCLRP